MILSAPRRGRMLLTIQVVTLAALFASTMPARAQQGAATPDSKADTKADTKAPAATHTKSGDSYSLGVSMGQRLRDAGVTEKDVSSERLAAGVRDALTGKVKMGMADQSNIDALVERSRAPAGEANHRAAAAFLAENGKKAGVITTASGLQYKVLTPGSGASPKLTDLVVVNYRGSLLDGTEFDNSAKHGGPATFQVGRIIPGWKEALQLMKPGAKYQLFIPPQLAYDMRSPPEIPPGSMLLFDVELLSVKSPQSAAAPPNAPPQPNK
jgi:FKBP-type peptidyl-prolyl cis-trans isomerase FklB